MDDFERFKTSVEEIIENVVYTDIKLELEMEPEDVTELLQCHDKTWVDEKLFLMDKQRSGFLFGSILPIEELLSMLESVLSNPASGLSLSVLIYVVV